MTKHERQLVVRKEEKKRSSGSTKHVEILEKAKKKKKGATGPKVRKQGSKNLYLLCLLDPWEGPLAGIPDQVTMKSVKFRTVVRLSLSTNASCTWLACAIAPCLAGNLVFAGGNTSGSNLHSVVSGSGALESTTASTFGNVLNTNDLNMIMTTFASVRPVSMGVKVTCTQALTAATGVHGLRLLPSSAFPWGIDSTASVTGGLALSSIMSTTLANGGTNGPTYTGPVAPQSISAAISALENTVNVTEPVAALWSPEDVSSLEYTAANGALAVGAAAQFGTFTYTNATLSENDVYAVPYTVLSSYTSAPEVASTFVTRDAADLPYILYAASGVTTGPLGELEVAICWEGIPLPFTSGVLGPTVSPSVPDEMAQAGNLLEVIPSAYCPEASADSNRLVIEAAKKTAGHLYDGTDKKAAISGASILRGGGAVVSALSPLLGMIPGVGGILGPGAALIGGMAANL